MHNPRGIWIHKLVLSLNHGRLITFCLLFALMFFTFMLLGLEIQAGAVGLPLFFSFILSYMICASHYIQERTLESANKLLHQSSLDTDQRADVIAKLEYKPTSFQLRYLIVALVLGCGHSWLLIGASNLSELSDALQFMSALELFYNFLTLVVWGVITQVIAVLTNNAQVISSLTDSVPVNLLNTEPLAAFSLVAVYSTLVLIGGQAGMALLFLDQAIVPVTLLPGFFGMFFPMLYLLLLPVLPIRRRIRDAKQAAISNVQRLIAETQTTEGRNSFALPELNKLQPLITYRQEIQRVSEWPFNLPVVTRLLVYLIIPPLTWVGAALIERLVDSAAS